MKKAPDDITKAGVGLVHYLMQGLTDMAHPSFRIDMFNIVVLGTSGKYMVFSLPLHFDHPYLVRPSLLPLFLEMAHTEAGVLMDNGDGE